jgi:DNA-directed RNA polymerase specialized sigma24 family protein
VDRVNEDSSTAESPTTPDQFETFYSAEYPKLVKALMVVGATFEEAEDAVQKAMESLLCSRGPLTNAVGWVWRAAYRYFVKERDRDRDRRPREIKGGHLVTEANIDELLTSGEDLVS